jgi:hypothetical protein
VNLSPGGAKLLAYWGSIQAGVAQRMGTAELWASVRFAATTDGFDISGATAIDMGQLRSLAASNRHAMDTLNRASGSAGLDASMIGRDLAGELRGYSLDQPQWLVRFEHNTITDQESVTQWRASLYSGTLPGTVNDLVSQLEADGELLSSEYGSEHVSIGAIRIDTL